MNLAQNIFGQRVEAVYIPEAEEPLDVTGEKRIHPFPVKCRLFRVGQQRRRQAAMKQPLGRSHAEGRQFTPQHRRQMYQPFAARQSVAKLPAGCQRGRPGGENLQLRENVSADCASSESAVANQPER